MLNPHCLLCLVVVVVVEDYRPVGFNVNNRVFLLKSTGVLNDKGLTVRFWRKKKHKHAQLSPDSLQKKQ